MISYITTWRRVDLVPTNLLTMFQQMSSLYVMQRLHWGAVQVLVSRHLGLAWTHRVILGQDVLKGHGGQHIMIGRDDRHCWQGSEV